MQPIMNTFYNAPVGRENWSIKHIKPRANTQILKKAQTLKKNALLNKKDKASLQRLPTIVPTVEPVPPRFVSKVMQNHYRTHDRVTECAKRAGRIVETSADTIRRARETIGVWRAAQDHFDDVVERKVETELLKSP